MRFGPRERLLAFGITQTALLTAALLGVGRVSEPMRLGATLAFSSGLAALVWLLPLLLTERGRGRLDSLLVVALAAAAAYAPAGLALALQGSGFENWRVLLPAGLVVAAVVAVLRARLADPAATATARGAFGFFSAALVVALVVGPDPLAAASLLVQVLVVMRVLVRLSSVGRGRKGDAAVVLANPFVPGLGLMVATGAFAAARGEPIHLDPTPTLLVAALAFSWLVPALMVDRDVGARWT